MSSSENDKKQIDAIDVKDAAAKVIGQQKREKPIDDEFEIIEDTGDQALISYYNDAPASP